MVFKLLELENDEEKIDPNSRERETIWNETNDLQIKLNWFSKTMLVSNHNKMRIFYYLAVIYEVPTASMN